MRCHIGRTTTAKKSAVAFIRTMCTRKVLSKLTGSPEDARLLLEENVQFSREGEGGSDQMLKVNSAAFRAWETR